MKKLLMASLLALATCGGPAMAAHDGSGGATIAPARLCTDTKAQMEKFFNTSYPDLTVAAKSTVNPGGKLELWRAGSAAEDVWMIFVEQPGGKTCVVASGNGWSQWGL